MMHPIRGAAWLVMASLLLSACKGGGSDTSTSATPTPTVIVSSGAALGTGEQSAKHQRADRTPRYSSAAN